MRKWNTIFNRQTYLPMLVLFVFVVHQISAQSNVTLYQLSTVPQSKMLNPALDVGSKYYFSLPFLSGMNVGWSSSSFSTRALGVEGIGLRLGQGTSYGDLSQMVSGSGHIHAQFHTDLLHVGFKNSIGDWSFAISEFFDANAQFGADLFGLLGDASANIPFSNQAYDLSDVNGRLLHYRSFSVAYAKSFSEKLRLGVRLKYLWGYSNIKVENDGLKANATGEENGYELEGQLAYWGAGIRRMAHFNEDVFAYLSNPGNQGWALDLGFEYQYSDRIQLRGSIVDLGWINWANDIQMGTIEGFLGNPVEVYEGRRSDLLEGNAEQGGAYQTKLPTRIYLSGQYTLNNQAKVGLVLHPAIEEGRTHWAAAISYSAWFKKYLSFSLNYNIYNRSWFNLGTGLSLNLGALQVYAISDNALSFISESKISHWHTGINYTFGRIFDSPVKVSETPTTDFWNRIPSSSEPDAPPLWSTVTDDSKMASSSPFFLLIGDVRSREDGQPIDQVNMDVYELSIDGNKELIRTGRFPEGRFKIQLEAGKNYELFIEKDGFISNTFQITHTKSNSLARLFFIREMKEEYLYAQKGERLVLEHVEKMPNERARPAEEPKVICKVLQRTSLRQSATHESKVLQRIAIDTEVKLLEKTSKNWWKVQQGQQVGWMKAKLLREL